MCSINPAISTLPVPILSKVFSYLHIKDARLASATSKAFQHAAKENLALAANHLGQGNNQSAAIETGLNRFIANQGLERSRRDLSLRTSHSLMAATLPEAIAYIKASEGRNGVSANELSIKGVNLKLEEIENKNLEKVFSRILLYIPQEHQPREPLPENLSEKAAFIKIWIKNNQQALNGIAILDLRNLDITALPREVANLQNLTHLMLDDNPLIELPSLPNFPELQELHANHTKINELPDTWQTPKLTKLYLNNTELTRLPNPIPTGLSQLEIFQLKGSQNLKFLPHNFNLPNLKELDLSDSNLRYLPAYLFLPKLEKLDLSGTKVTALDGQYTLKALKHLYISRTGVKSMPQNLDADEKVQIVTDPGSLLHYFTRLDEAQNINRSVNAPLPVINAPLPGVNAPTSLANRVSTLASQALLKIRQGLAYAKTQANRRLKNPQRLAMKVAANLNPLKSVKVLAVASVVLASLYANPLIGQPQ